MCTLHKPVQSPFPRFILLQNNLEDAGKIQAIWKPSALPFLPNVQGNRVTSGRVRSPVSNSRLTFCSGPSLSATQKPGLWGVEVRLRPGGHSVPRPCCVLRGPGAPATQPTAQPRGPQVWAGTQPGAAPRQVALRLGIKALGTCPPGPRFHPLALELYKLPAGESQTRQANKRVPSSRRHLARRAMGQRRCPQRLSTSATHRPRK